MRELRLHRGRVGALAWAGHTLATGGQDRRIVLSDLRAPDPAARLAGHRAEVCGLKVRLVLFAAYAFKCSPVLFNQTQQWSAIVVAAHSAGRP